MAALKKDGHLYEESISMAEIDRIFGPLRELSSRSVANQDRIIKQIQVKQKSNHISKGLNI